MEILQFVLLVLIGGLIGWVTNKVAIKMLFRPVNPYKILGITFQGVFPKRKDQMAISLANIIEEELLSKEVIMDQLLGDDKLDSIKGKFKEIIVEKLVEVILPMVAMMLGGDARKFITKYIDSHGDKLFDQIMDEFRLVGMDSLDIKDIVKQRIDSLDFIAFEKIIFGLMSKELRFVEIIGLFLGAFIGVIQYAITIFL